jgi:uncharacterized damage-inducible protein DinB
MNTTALMTPATLLEHWQGHRRVTRQTIELFPEDQLFSFQPAAPMRSFGALIIEMIGMIEPTLKGVELGDLKGLESKDFSWAAFERLTTKAALLEVWDANTKLLDDAFKQIPSVQWTKIVSAFGMTQPLSGFATYLIENEIHHRAQGYVYLRLLKLEPPFFYPI